jgi:2-hydroxy-3-oxopropionate reductase
MTQSIALLGAGAMGGAIGARLVATGTALSVFDPDPAKVAALVALGASAAPSAAAAAARSGAVILSLNAPRIVRAAIFGPGGVAEGARPGTLIIDMSSISPEATTALAAEAAERGLRWVDSPLSGGCRAGPKPMWPKHKGSSPASPPTRHGWAAPAPGRPPS